MRPQKPMTLAAPLKLRQKLLVAFLVTSLMAGLCGAVGLLYVDRIAGIVAVFSKTTSPLQTESVELTENAQRMRAQFLVALNGNDDDEKVLRDLAALHEKSLGHLKTLRSLAADARVDIGLPATEQREREFFDTLNSTMEAFKRQQTAMRVTKERTIEFDEARAELDRLLVAAAVRAEAEISRIEEKIKVEVQTGKASAAEVGDLASNMLTETYPIIQIVYKLMRDSVRLEETAKWHLVQTGPGNFDTIERDAQNIFRTSNAIMARLAGRLRDTNGRADMGRIREAAGNLHEHMLGQDGLFAANRNGFAATAAVEAGKERLDDIEQSYFRTLDSVQSAVKTINEAAQKETASTISQALSVVLASIVLAVLASLLLGLVLAHRITRPLAQLTDHVSFIREKGELAGLADPALAKRPDEIGTLSRSFNLMIGELADARRQLIESSEAELRIQFERLDAAINNMPIGLCMFDAEQKLIICNSRYADLYGLGPELTVPGTPLRTILERRVGSGASPENDEYFVAERLAAVNDRKPWYSVTEMRNGHIIAVSHHPLPNGGSIAVHEDITEHRKAEAKIAYLAQHDVLTDLPNRVLFHEELNKALTRVSRGQTQGVLCIDLDYFKSVNDTLGHPVGDALLREVANRLRTCVRPSDVIARLGGDEFAVVQVGAEQPVGATALASRIIKTLSEPYEIDGHQLVIGASIGIAIAPNDGTDSDQLLKNADLALYRAKEDGRGIHCFFEPEMDARMQARRALELDLRKALTLDEFVVFYQPIMNLKSDELTGFEALLRWRHPQRGLVAPGEFIPLAEEIGLIGQIGAWVLKQACADAAKWPGDVSIAVNLSPNQFRNGTLVLDVIAALGQSGLAPRRLELEVTETILLQDTEATVATLNQLRELGVRISMDDFGTGYSSLGYLRKFPFDKIKIDQSFIRDLHDKPDSAAIVRAVTGLGTSLGIKTTAEGVETPEQLAKLRNEGCTEAQGYLFGKPQAIEDIAHLFKKHTASTAA